MNKPFLHLKLNYNEQNVSQALTMAARKKDEEIKALSREVDELKLEVDSLKYDVQDKDTKNERMIQELAKLRQLQVHKR